MALFDHPILPTTIVGSYPQPDWLIDRERLKASLPPRVRAETLWRIPEPWLADAQEAATLMAIRDQEELGIDIVGDGEMRRESYSNRLATALSGIDREKHGTAIDRTGNANPVPLVSGPIRRVAPIEAQDAAFLRRHSAKPVKLTGGRRCRPARRTLSAGTRGRSEQLCDRGDKPRARRGRRDDRAAYLFRLCDGASRCGRDRTQAQGL